MDQVNQYSLKEILIIWFWASVPGGVLFWTGLPLLEKYIPIPPGFLVMMVMSLSLTWMFIYSLILVKKEEGNLKWDSIRSRLRLNGPIDPKTDLANRKLWFWVIPLIAAFALVSITSPLEFLDRLWADLLPIKEISRYSSDQFLASAKIRTSLIGAWWFPVFWLYLGIVNMAEELIFRGILLPKMEKCFGKFDWVVNGALFAFYHLEKPWVFPGFLLFDTLLFAYPAKRLRSTWVPIVVHFSQTIYFMFLVFGIVLGLS